MADERISVEIVLDDGSIQKGFVKLEKQAEDTAKKIGDSFGESSKGFNLDAVKDGFASLAPAIASVAAAGVLLKKAFDFTLEGESINALNAQFDALAQREGIVGEELKSGLEKSAKGLIDTTDLLKEANGAIAILGDQASRLPEILEIARKSSAVFGGTAQESFGNIITAIENGNQRLLKNSGIVLDTDKVYREFAKSIGVTANELTLAQRQAALLDAAIQKGNQTFQGITTDSKPATNALQRLNVAIHEFNEALATSAASTFGGVLSNIADFATRAIKELTPSSQVQTIDSVSASLEHLQQVKEKLVAGGAANEEGFLSGIARFLQPGVIQNGIQSLQSVNAEIEKQTALLDDLKKKHEEELAAAQSSSISQAADAQLLTREQIAQFEARTNAFNANLLSIEQSTIETDANILALQDVTLNTREQREFLLSERLKLLEEDRLIKIAELNKQYSDQAGFDEADRLDAQAALNENYVRKAVDLKAKQVASEQALEKQKLQGTSSILGQISTLQNSSSRELFEVGKAAAISQATINGYLGVTDVLSGKVIPYPYNIPFAVLVGAAAAANVASIAATPFGGGTTGGTGFSAAGGGGGIAAQPVSTPGFADNTGVTNNFENVAKPQTKIEVNIAGSVLDSQETGLRIVELLNSAFDQQGVVVT